MEEGNVPMRCLGDVMYVYGGKIGLTGKTNVAVSSIYKLDYHNGLVFN